MNSFCRIVFGVLIGFGFLLSFVVTSPFGMVVFLVAGFLLLWKGRP